MPLPEIFAKLRPRWQEMTGRIREWTSSLADKRNMVLALLVALLLLFSLLIFFSLRDTTESGETFALPDDGGILSLHSSVHPRSPLAPALKAYRKGYQTRAADILEELLEQDLARKLRCRILNYLGHLALDEGNESRAKQYFQRSLAIDETASAFYGMGRVALAHNDNDAARDRFLESLDEDDTYYRSMIALGKLAMQWQDYKQAGEWFSRVLRKYKRPEVRYRLALSQLRRDHLKKAETNFKKVLASTSDKGLSAYANARLGDIQDRRNDLSRAVRFYRQAVAMAPGEPVFHYNLGVLYLRQKDLPGALSAFERVHRLSGKDHKVTRLLGELYYDKQEYDQALGYFRQLVSETENPDVELAAVLADLYFIRSDYDRARSAYLDVIDRRPNSRLANQARINLGNIALQQQDWAEALSWYDKAREKSSGNGRLHYNRGLALWRQGQEAAAAGAFFKAFQLDRDLIHALEAGVDILIEAGLARRAVNLLRDMLKSGTADPHIQLGLARLYRLQGDYEEARRQANMVLGLAAKKPLRLRAFLALARIHLAADKLSGASGPLQQAYRLAPRNPVLLYLYGIWHFKGESWQDAERYFEDSLRFKPPKKVRCESLYMLGVLAWGRDDLDNAVHYFRKTLAECPGHSKSSYNLAACRRELQTSGARP